MFATINCRTSSELSVQCLGPTRLSMETDVVSYGKSQLQECQTEAYIIRIMAQSSEKVEFSFKAHAGEITDIALHEGTDAFIATSGRDRHVQVFRKKGDTWD